MTAPLTRQYRPIATSETAADDALTVRAIRELAAGMNNFKAHMAGKIFGRVGAITRNHGAASTEQAVATATRPIASGYNYLVFQIGGHLKAEATGTSTWKLYSSAEPYSGPQAFDAKYLGPIYSVSTAIVINSTSDMCPVAVDDLIVHRDINGYTHLTLTAQNSVAAEGDYAQLWSIAVTPKVIIS